MFRIIAFVLVGLFSLKDQGTMAFVPASRKNHGWNNNNNKGDAAVSLRRPKSGLVAMSTSQSRSRHSSLSMAVIDRLSDECVEAIKTSQSLGSEIGLTVLRHEILFAGIVSKPERAAGTLRKFKIDFPLVAEKSTTFLQTRSGVDLVDGSTDPQKGPLPFSSTSKEVLETALRIADVRYSESVRSEHVLLALMGYNFGKPIQSAPILEVLTTMKELRGLYDKGFSVFKFCEELISDLDTQPDTDNEVSGTGSRTERIVVNDSGGLGIGTSALANVGVDLTQMALEGKLDNVYGRDNEIRTALRTLGRRRKNNPCLVGDPGVGKTAVAEAIAQVLASAIAEDKEEKKFKFPIKNPFRRKDKEMMNNDDTPEEIEYILPACPDALAGARLISIDLASLVADTSNRGDFEKKVQNVIKEASSQNVILFIDEVHNLIGTGGNGGGTMNAANLLKPALARGELRILGATTTPEYRQYIESDGALERRFQPLDVKEPSVEETIDILATIMPQYEEFHGVEYTSNSLVAAAKLSDRYVSDRFLPDKAIDLLDEAGSMIKMSEGEEFFVTEDSISEVVSDISGIPVGRLDTGEKERLRNLDLEIGERIKGQQQAVRAVAKSVRRARSGMRDSKRPISSFMFVGPTGVGKTELCKALASTYYGKEKDLIRCDMSEYMDRFSVTRLIGSPPGYVGYDEGGQLTEAVRRNPHSVILFDELEKVMDEGQLTDGKGRTVNFKNTIFVMTSNIGSKGILARSRDPNADDSIEETTKFVKGELEEAMKPELLNRIDEIIVFNPLSYDNLKDIAVNLVNEIVDRAKEDQGIRVAVSENIIEKVTREGLAAEFGARPIRRAAKRFVEDPLAEAIVEEFLKEDGHVSLDLVSGKDAVKVTNLAGGNKSIVIEVDGDGGMGVGSSLEFERLYGPAPSLDDDDDDSLPREPDGFQ